MLALKTKRTCVYLTTVAQQPSASRMSGFSQASPEFSSSRGCLVAEKVREKKRKGEMGENPKIEHHVLCLSKGPLGQQYIKWLYIAVPRSEKQKIPMSIVITSRVKLENIQNGVVLGRKWEVGQLRASRKIRACANFCAALKITLHFWLPALVFCISFFPILKEINPDPLCMD